MTNPNITAVVRLCVTSSVRIENVTFLVCVGKNIAQSIEEKLGLLHLRQGDIRDHADELASAIAAHFRVDGHRSECCIHTIESNGEEILQINSYRSSGTLIADEPFDIFVHPENKKFGIVKWHKAEIPFEL